MTNWANSDAQASFTDFLERILIAENQARFEHSRSTLLKMATLPTIKTLEQYDFTDVYRTH